MHDAARELNDGLPQRVDGLIDSHCSEEEFLRQLTVLCAGARDSAWAVLARIDQNYRRGKLSPERFRLARLSIERRMLGINDSRVASGNPRAREPDAPSAPAIEALAVFELPPRVVEAPVPAPALWLAPLPVSATRSNAAETAVRVAADASRRWRWPIVAAVLTLLILALIVQMQHANQPSVAPLVTTAAAEPLVAVPEAVPAAAPSPAHVGFDEDRAVVQPGQAVAEATVVRTGDTRAEIRIPWWTESAGARAGQDFVARGRRMLVLAPGEARASVQVPILRNAQRRHIQLFYIRLGKPTGAELDPAARVVVFIVPR